MQGLQITDHSAWRQATRAIPNRAIQAAMDYGRCFWAGRGCMAWYLGRRAVKAARRRHRARLERFRNIAVIIAQDGAVVTVEHCARPLRHWKPA
jgi:hypothetical protein